MKTYKELVEKHLTPAEKKKREEIALAIERDNPGMDKGKKMAIATATAKRVAEETVDEGKFLQTHLASGKPNPAHPAYPTHKAVYDAEKAKAPKNWRAGSLSSLLKSSKSKAPHPSEKVTMNDFHQASAGAPDIDEHDVVNSVAKKHGIKWEHAQKGLDKHAKTMGYKSFSHHLADVYSYANESVNKTLEENEESIYSDIVKHTERPIAKYKALGGEEHFGTRLHSIGEMLAKKHGVHPKEMHKKIADHVDKQFNESVEIDESLNELSKQTLGSYMTKAKDNLIANSYALGAKTVIDNFTEIGAAIKNRKGGTQKIKNDLENRRKGMDMAIKKVVKEGVEGRVEGVMPSFAEFINETSPFDWKKAPSEISWDKNKSSVQKTETGLVHKAREHARNAEANAAMEKKNVGRPTGTYGSYKIDKATRDDPEYKKALSAKVRAAKADGLAARGEYKAAMDAAIKKRQLEIAGISEAAGKKSYPDYHIHKLELNK